jgi:cation diffusion facilitator CzcD-associated flavoprotein CzcO
MISMPSNTHPRDIQNLDELAAQVRYELDCLGYPAREWVAPRSVDGAPVHDAIIIGGGQNGISIAFRLMRERVTNVRVLDRNPAGQEGPWLKFARMHTLRTPKTVSGPELGVPSLSIRAYYEARFGKAAWAALGKIPRAQWQDYLSWVRQTVGIDVTNDVTVTDIEPLADGLLAVHTQSAGGPGRVLARNVVFATGIEGSGRWVVPPMIEQTVPRTHYAHTANAIDFAALRGKRVAVLGGGASAFDNAATALEAGAASVDLYVRRKALPAVNPNRWIEFCGFMRHFADLDDARKWQFMKTIFDMNQPPPQDTFDRCARHGNFTLHLGSPIQAIEFADGTLRLSTPQGVDAVDFLIVGTGFAVDLASRPELARFSGEIALWADRYDPPVGDERPVMAGFPYLTDSFQFTEKVPGAAPYLKNIYNHTFGAMLSLAGAAGISQLKFSTDRIALGITRQLFLEDADAYLQSLRDYDVSELDISAYMVMRADAKSEAA